jgi:hypothetical protein
MDWKYIHTGERQAAAFDMVARGERLALYGTRYRGDDTLIYAHLAELEHGLKRVINVWAYLDDTHRSLLRKHPGVPPQAVCKELVCLTITANAINEHIKMFQRFIRDEKRRLAE